MKKAHIQGTEFVTTHDQLEDRKLRHCRDGTKRVRATCCDSNRLITVTLGDSVCDALDRAAYYIKTLPQRIAEVEAAAEAVLEEGRRQGA
jgi:hypothetical protein